MNNLGLHIFNEHTNTIPNNTINQQLFNQAILGNTENCKKLLEQCADADPNMYIITNVVNGYSQTSLMASVVHRHYETTELLLKYGADPNQYAVISEGDQPNALIYAIWNNDHKMCKLLIENGAINTYNSFMSPIRVLINVAEMAVDIDYYDTIRTVLIEQPCFSKKFNCNYLLDIYMNSHNPRIIDLYSEYVINNFPKGNDNVISAPCALINNISDFTLFFRINESVKTAIKYNHKNVIKLLGNMVYKYWLDYLPSFHTEISNYIKERKILISLVKDSTDHKKMRTDVLRLIADYI